MTSEQPPTDGPFQPGDEVEINIAGLSPVALTDVLLDLDADEDWHQAVIIEALEDGAYAVQVLPLVGAIEVPPVDASRLRRR
jgi:protein involved in polysaccharide export with SLBB domain